MSKYLRRIDLVDSCVHISGSVALGGKPTSLSVSLRDYLHSLDQLAHSYSDTVPDGSLSAEEFEQLKRSGKTPTLDTFSSYEAFGRAMDEYIATSLKENPKCLCKNGNLIQGESGPQCIPFFRPITPSARDPQASKRRSQVPKPQKALPMPAAEAKPNSATAPQEQSPAEPVPWSLSPLATGPQGTAAPLTREDYQTHLPFLSPPFPVSNKGYDYWKKRQLKSASESKPNRPGKSHHNFCRDAVKVPKDPNAAEQVVGVIVGSIPQLVSGIFFFHEVVCAGKGTPRRVR